eukprot:309530_1
MWVQEGHDSKESGDAASSHNPSLFSRIYSHAPSRSKQSVTTIGIPMKSTSPKPQPSQNQKSISNMNVAIADEKDEEESPQDSPQESPVPVSPVPPLKSVFTPPISPAVFLQNMKQKCVTDPIREEDHAVDDGDHDVPMFTVDEDSNHIEHTDQMDEVSNGLWDLAIVGKKLNIPILADYPNITQDEEDDDEDESMSNHQESDEKYYIPRVFDGLDIERASEWERCIEYTQHKNGLLIAEVYSSTFGVSDVMYPFIDEILQNKPTKNIKFIRLRMHKMKTLKEIKQVITDHASFVSSPIPMYIFIKNGTKVDTLYGAKLIEFERLIDEYTKDEPQRPQTAPIKYTSIWTQRPETSLSLAASPVKNKENQSIQSNIQSTERVENITNLIKDWDVNQYQTTRLSKNTSLRTTPVNEINDDGMP